MPPGTMAPGTGRPATGGRTVPLAVGGTIAAAFAGLIGFARWVGTWVLAARGEDDPGSWIYAVVPTAVQVLLALVGVGLALAAVLPREGRRPALVAVLAFAVLVAGFTVNDAIYQVVTSIYFG